MHRTSTNNTDSSPLTKCVFVFIKWESDTHTRTHTHNTPIDNNQGAISLMEVEEGGKRGEVLQNKDINRVLRIN